MNPTRNQAEPTTSQQSRSHIAEPAKLRVLLADDHDLVRETIACFLSQASKVDVHGVGSLDEALQAFVDHGDFAMVLLDLMMPGMDDLHGLERMLDVANGVPVAMMSGMMQPHKVEQAISLGASGFLPKSMSSRTLAAAIQFIAAGEKYLPYDYQQQTDEADNFGLKSRELDVLRGVANGMSNKEIALLHDLQEVTVKFHVKTLSRKLNARNRTQAAMIARDAGLV